MLSNGKDYLRQLLQTRGYSQPPRRDALEQPAQEAQDMGYLLLAQYREHGVPAQEDPHCSSNGDRGDFHDIIILRSIAMFQGIYATNRAGFSSKG